MWLRTIEGEFINTEHALMLAIKREKTGQYGDLACAFADGTNIHRRIHMSDWDEFESSRCYSPLIKADPGYWALAYYPDNDEVERWPVLAWRIDEDTATTGS